MSWSISMVGKSPAVVAKAKIQLTNQKCSEPEETIKGKILDVIETCLSAFPADHPVEVSAIGSQSTDAAKPGIAVNQLQVTVKPLWGFIE